MVERALRSVVREALAQAAQQGLPGDHHFYLTFNLSHPGVEVPPYLREQYGEEMTIVLQYQFYGLDVDDEAMGVTLSFNNKPERLIVPLAAITTFADPSVNFALQFQILPSQESDNDEDEDAPDAAPPRPLAVADGGDRAAAKSADGDQPAPPGADDDSHEDTDGDDAEDGGDDDKVVTLDKFRKK